MSVERTVKPLRYLLAGAGVAVLSLMCGSPDLNAQSPSCSPDSCEIVLNRVVGLPDVAGLSLHGPLAYVIRDGRGRFFARAANRRQVVVYDASGKWLSTIDPPSTAPRSWIALFAGPGGTVVVWTWPDGDSFAIDDRLALVKRPPIPYQPNFIRDDGSAVVAMNIPTASLAGFPLHLVDKGGNIGGSFGSDTPEYRSDLRLLIERVAAPARDDSVWAMPRGRYSLERWNAQTGKLISRTAIHSNWFKESRTYPADEFTRPAPIVQSLWEKDGLIWVIVRDADQKWRAGGPGEAAWTVARMNATYDWVVEVIEPRSGDVVASRRFDGSVVANPPQDLLASYAQTQAGVANGLDVFVPQLRQKGKS
jgi:hypothetical protein